MAIYVGPGLSTGRIRLGSPIPQLIKLYETANDVREQAQYWLEKAPHDARIVYFWAYLNEAAVGAFFLHDIDEAAGEGLIGYHLFQRSDRGKGIGGKALGLLAHYANEHTKLRQLTIITGYDNEASKQIAKRNGFTYAGEAREDPANLAVYIKRLDK